MKFGSLVPAGPGFPVWAMACGGEMRYTRTYWCVSEKGGRDPHTTEVPI